MNDTVKIKEDDTFSIKKTLSLVTAVGLIAGGGGSWATVKAQGNSLSKDIAGLEQSLEQTDLALKAQAASIKEQIRELAAASKLDLHKHENSDTHMSFEDKIKVFATKGEVSTITNDLKELRSHQREALVLLTRIDAQMKIQEAKAKVAE